MHKTAGEDVAVSRKDATSVRAQQALAAAAQAVVPTQPEMNYSGIMMIRCWCSPVICWRKSHRN